MSLLKSITPSNFLAEKEKFFNDQTYNPQFEYDDPFNPEELLEYGPPDSTLLNQAQRILHEAFSNHTEDQIEALEGPEVSQEVVTDKIMQFLKMHDLETQYHILFSNSFIARTSVNNDTIKIRLPVKYRQNDLIGMIYHELGTHALRRYNYEQQPFYKKKKKYGFESYLVTEEGLAVLHSLLAFNYKFAYRPARYYVASALAQNYSFAETFAQLKTIFADPEKRWTAVLRQKRGITDTSQPGGFTKDLVYFKGLVEVVQWLKQHNYNLESLYFGKIAKEDVQKAKLLNPNYKPLLPSFYVANRDAYIEQIEEIGKVNYIFS
jgi:hypothetical protein